MELELNLDPNFINNYWQQKNSNFYKFLEEASKLETWTLTNNTLFQEQLNKLVESMKGWMTINWAKNDDNVIKLMGHMTISQFSFLLHYIDSKFPGLSFHYVMECRQISTDSLDNKELFLERIKLINDSSFLNEILSPMRTRLIHSLIKEND